MKREGFLVGLWGCVAPTTVMCLLPDRSDFFCGCLCPLRRLEAGYEAANGICARVFSRHVRRQRHHTLPAAPACHALEQPTNTISAQKQLFLRRPCRFGTRYNTMHSLSSKTTTFPRQVAASHARYPPSASSLRPALSAILLAGGYQAVPILCRGHRAVAPGPPTRRPLRPRRRLADADRRPAAANNGERFWEPRREWCFGKELTRRASSPARAVPGEDRHDDTREEFPSGLSSPIFRPEISNAPLLQPPHVNLLAALRHPRLPKQPSVRLGRPALPPAEQLLQRRAASAPPAAAGAPTDGAFEPHVLFVLAGAAYGRSGGTRDAWPAGGQAQARGVVGAAGAQRREPPCCRAGRFFRHALRVGAVP